MMFEQFRFKAFALQNTAVLSLFSNGITTGLVAESGEGCTYTVPVFEGYAIPHAIFKMEVGTCLILLRRGSAVSDSS